MRPTYTRLSQERSPSGPFWMLASDSLANVKPSSPDLPRQLLADQLAIVWGFAERFVWPRIDLDLCLWKPSDNMVGLRPAGHMWAADWPDEQATPLPEPTAGWLIWHIGWWWTNALQACRGQATVEATDHLWDGTLSSVEASRRDWLALLDGSPLDEPVEGLMPTPKPLWYVAGWVNFELTKNVSEIHQLILRLSNEGVSR